VKKVKKIWQKAAIEMSVLVRMDNNRNSIAIRGGNEHLQCNEANAKQFEPKLLSVKKDDKPGD
jgi:hypothetical protein